MFGQPTNPTAHRNSVFNDSLYCAPAYKLYGTALRAVLHNIIKNHTVVSYNDLWTYFQTTDVKPNGKVWDMYSDIPGGTPAYEYTFITNQCGNYTGEGSCYNREHSWPKSWFNDVSPPYSDIFHLFPTDGTVNGIRSNYPYYGNVASATPTTTNGSKLGPCSYPGYSGIVFEPINAYKGDLARSHLYMSVRYYSEDSGWLTSNGTNKSNLLPWYANLLYDWHITDTVSLKEINRNNLIYSNIQHNRNPFIDHPEFAAEIWKTDMPPAVISANNISSTTTVVDFSRYLDSTQAVTTTNFEFDNGIGNPASIQWGDSHDVSIIMIATSTLAPGTTYSVQIKNQKSINGIAMNDTTISFRTAGATRINEAMSRPSKFTLEQNYPNPFNPKTVISCQL